MYCSNCGFKNKDGAVFCEECGSKLKVKKVVEEKPKQEEKTEVVKEEPKKEEKIETVEEVAKEEKINNEDNKKTSNGSKTPIIIVIIIIAIVGIWYAKNNFIGKNLDNESVSQKGNNIVLEEVETSKEMAEWANKYYDFLKEAKEDESKVNENIGISDDATNTAIQFYKSEDFDNPVMFLNYDTPAGKACNVYCYQDNENITFSKYTDNREVVKLYDKKVEEDRYFIHIKSSDNEHDNFYSADYIVNIITQNSEKIDHISAEELQDLVIVIQGNEMDISDPNSEFNKRFQETEDNFVEIDLKGSDEDLLDNINTAVSESNIEEPKQEAENENTITNTATNTLTNTTTNTTTNTLTNTTTTNTVADANTINNNKDLDFSTTDEIVYEWTDAQPQSEYLKDTLTLRKDGTVVKVEESMGTATLKGTYTYQDGKIIATYTEETTVDPEGESTFRVNNLTNEFEFINGILYENVRSYKHEFTRIK